MDPASLFSSSPLVKRWGGFAYSDISRVVFGEFDSGSRSALIAGQVLAFTEEETHSLLDQILARFSSRHNDIRDILARNGQRTLTRAGVTDSVREDQLLLLGSYTSHEYSTEAAALTNPSAVLHPDQSGLTDKQVRVAISLRAIGEGHISSIVFMSAILDSDRGPIIGARLQPQITGELTSIGVNNLIPQTGLWSAFLEDIGDYTVTFPDNSDLSQRILRPNSKPESKGMEDARFVRMIDMGESEYRATYTAYDGTTIRSRMIVSPDLKTFSISDMTGPASMNKGIALFPQKINGEWFALCRSDGFTLGVARSKDGIYWESSAALSDVLEPWNLLIAGNAGSPHLTEAGWLVITHGVGPMRTYALGAMLLDRDDPTRVLGRLSGPLITPNEDEASGYVPNVIYSCGNIISKDTLWLPYGISDRSASFASINVPALLEAILS